MRRRVAALLVLSLAVGMLAVSLVGPSAALGGVTKLTATLSGDEEVPGPGDDNGSGKATIKLIPDKGKVCFTITWKKIGPPFAAHIHEGESGVSGGVVVTLFEGETLDDTINKVGGCAKKVSKATINDIKADPGGFYVNVHNDDFPPGAVRGQLG